MSNIDTLLDNLHSKRQIGDKHADGFIGDVIEKHELNELNTFFKRLVYNNQIHGDDSPSEFRNYINENSDLPPWADIHKIALAQETFVKVGPAFILAYFCKSLPECYACGNGAEILYKTGRLTQHTRRRIAQTAQFVLDVMSPGGMEPDGRGIATSLKVRLMHASMRFYFMKEVGKGNIEYDASRTGYPINQEDLLGTMLAFSYVVIEGIESLGIKMTNEEKEAVLHIWNCIGYLIGIEDVEQIENYDDAGKVWNAITVSQFSKTDEGIALNNLLVELLDEILHEKILEDVVPILMHHLLEKKVISILDVRTPKHYNPIAVVSYFLGMLLLKLDSRGSLSRFMSHYVNMKLMIGLEKYISEGEDTGIYIPPSLKSDWNMNNIVKSMFKFGAGR